MTARAGVICLVTALSVAAGVTGCGGDDDSDEGQGLEVGYAFGFDAGDTSDRLAFDRLVRNTDIEPSFVETGGTPEAIAALTRGDIDMAKVIFPDAINAIAEGADIRLILTVNPKLDDVLAAPPEVETVAELRGGRILAGRPGPNPELAALGDVLQRAGLDEDDYELEFVPDSQDRSAALVSGRADAATLESVDIELAGGDAKLKQLADLGGKQPGPSGVLAVRRDFAEQNQALLEDVVRELRAGFQELYGPNGRDAWVDKAREEDLADQPEEVAARIYEGHRELGYWPKGSPITEAQHARVVDYLVENEVVENPVPFDEVWDISFWTAAAQGG
jgi:ABC-type nitrate/sulfonate/bicarbonate transport system substrate-binding protein